MPLNYLGILLVVIGAMIFKLQYNHRGKKYRDKKEKQETGNSFFKYIYVYLQITTPLFAILTYIMGSQFGQLFFTPQTFFIGVCLSYLGLIGLIWSKKSLGGNYSPCFDTYYPHGIVQNGPYRYIRHPIYSFNILSLFALFLSSGSLFVLLNTILMSLYYIKSAKKEEETLSRKFDQYRFNQEKTGMFFPKMKRFL